MLNGMSNTFSGSIDLDQLVVLALTRGIAISTDIVSQIAIVNTVDWGIGQVLLASIITATKTARLRYRLMENSGGPNRLLDSNAA